MPASILEALLVDPRTTRLLDSIERNAPTEPIDNVALIRVSGLLTERGSAFVQANQSYYQAFVPEVVS